MHFSMRDLPHKSVSPNLRIESTAFSLDPSIKCMPRLVELAIVLPKPELHKRHEELWLCAPAPVTILMSGRFGHFQTAIDSIVSAS